MRKKKDEIDEVVPSIRLNKLVESWNAVGTGARASEKSGDAWLKLCAFVRDSKVTRGQLLYAMIKIRGMKPSSAGVVASRLLRFQKSEEASALLDRALAGENVSAHELRGVNKTDPEKIVLAKLRVAARNAMNTMKHDKFVESAGLAYVKAKVRHTKKTMEEAPSSK